MYAVEFEATIRDGVVRIPEQYSRLKNGPARIVVMVDDMSTPATESVTLDLAKLHIEGFKGRDAVEVQREMRDDW